MSSAEERVRAAWERVDFREPHALYGPGCVYVLLSSAFKCFPDWAAADQFTAERLTRIADLQEMIDMVRASELTAAWYVHGSTDPDDLAKWGRREIVWGRILAILERHLEELQRGMKGGE